MHTRLQYFFFGLCGWLMCACASPQWFGRSVSTKASLSSVDGALNWSRQDAKGPHWSGDSLQEGLDQAQSSTIPTSLDVGTPYAPARLGLFLGVGEAPYDDALQPNDLQFKEPNGFSDSVIYLSYEAPLRKQVHWFSQVSAFRFQSQSLFETLEEGRIGWVTLGLRWTW